MKYPILVLIVLTVLFPLAASGQKEPKNIVDRTDVQAGEVVNITVTSSGLRFNPDGIRVRQGVTVRLSYESGGGTHDWVLDKFDAATARVTGGEKDMVEFQVDKAGTFEFYCSIPGHRIAGMRGAFIVI